ncbi:hypothetical protein GFK26_18145 [Variovorax paradoxus]|uniref:Lipoprotein n=1 Tax=Variovorax paradoxus TaxID=34073 RepID=A0A5Q0M482_VARPD|nr:hypothetical protein [Variovorax paradoxus]QFZ84550.1 hypothetical protein GFK26_18145 [Variovorax paradoxus]
MKKTTLALVFAALALAGCGKDDTIQPMNMGQGSEAPHAPVAPVQAAAPQGDNGWLWGVGGYLLGRMTAPKATPQHVPAPAPGFAPQAAAPQQPKRSWFAPTPRPNVPNVVPKAPMVSTTPKSSPIPVPSAAPKPSYSGPSSYKAPSYSFKPSAPRSSPSRSSSSSSRR